MREHAIAGLRLRRRVRTTVPEPADQKVPDLLHRDFTAAEASQSDAKVPVDVAPCLTRPPRAGC
jgi:hypothetical protein